MKNFLYIFLILPFIACSNSKDNLDFRLLPTDVPFHEISITDISDYGQLSHLIDSLNCNWDLNVLLRISMDKNQFEAQSKDQNQVVFQPISFCDKRGVSEKNVLHIFNDLEMKENEYRNIVFPEDSLKRKLTQFLLNPDPRYDLASSPNRAVLYFNLNPKTSLSKVAEIFKTMAFTFHNIQKEHPNIKLYFIPTLYLFVPPPTPSTIQ